MSSMPSHPPQGADVLIGMSRMFCLMLGAIACASCSMNLRPHPETSGQIIAGQWRLQSPSRETLARNLRAVLEQARAQEEQRERRRYPDSIPPEEGTAAPGTAASLPANGRAQTGGSQQRAFRASNWEIREQREQQEALLSVVLPSEKLQIDQTPNRVEMLPDTGAKRRFDMGVNSTLVRSYATFRIESGWQKNMFVVHSRDRETGIDIVERYQRVGSNVLHVQVELSLPHIKDQVFAADYVLAQP
jgi:hypothetical protein